MELILLAIERRLESRRHRVAYHRVVAARLAVAFTSVFAVGALMLALVAPDVRQASLAAAAAGGVMLAVAVIILVRAQSLHRALLAGERAARAGSRRMRPLGADFGRPRLLNPGVQFFSPGG